MKQLLLTLLLLTGIASAAAGDGISGNWRCQTISYQQYGNNYLIFIDNTHWQHKEDGSLHGEGKLEVRIYSKNNPQARLYFDYASDGSWRQAGDKILLETIKPRLVRALELILTSGQTPSALYAAQQTRRPPWPTLAIGLNPARAVLHQRIAERFQMMIAQGFIDEVAALKARPQLSLAAPSMRSVGYRQIWQYLDGASDRESAIEQGIIASRQLAKRQITWMNNRLGRDLAISQYDPLAKPTAALDAIEKYLQQPPAKPI